MKKLISQKLLLVLMLPSIIPSTALSMSSASSPHATQESHKQQAAHNAQREIPRKQQAQQPEKLGTTQDHNQTPKKPESVSDYIKAKITQTLQPLKQLHLSSTFRKIAVFAVSAVVLITIKKNICGDYKIQECSICMEVKQVFAACSDKICSNAHLICRQCIKVLPKRECPYCLRPL